MALFDGLAICESADAALRLQRTAEECSNGLWQAKTLATASIEEVGGQYGNCGLQRCHTCDRRELYGNYRCLYKP